MNPNKKTIQFSAITIGVISIGLVIFFSLINIFVTTPKRAQELFGPPAAGVSGLKLIQISKLLVENQSDLITPVGTSSQPKLFEITFKQTATEILASLKSHNLIPNTETLLMYIIYTGADKQLKTGIFSLPQNLPPILIIEEIKQTGKALIPITIFAGTRIEEIAEQFEYLGVSTAEDFYQALASIDKNQFEWLAELSSIETLEGFLAPGNYTHFPGTSMKLLIEEMLSNFDPFYAKDVTKGIEKQGLSFYQAVILASIIERESIVADENPIIASVFLNRLEIGMKLESDTTTQYAIGYNSLQSQWWTNPLSYANLQYDSVYNTYVYYGLPPSPISTISEQAILAVANPAKTNFLFFQAKCDGSGEHNFAVTYEEHLANSCP